MTFLPLSVQAQDAVVTIDQASSALEAQQDPDFPKRLEAAVAYEKVTPIETNVMATFDELKKLPQFGGEDNELLQKLIDSFDIDLVRKESIRLMATHFTVEEMNALTEFYKTPMGQSIYKKMPKFQADFMPVMQGEMNKAIMIGMEEAMKKVNQDIQAIQQQQAE